MKKLLLAILFFSASALAQNSPIAGWCMNGNQPVVTSGIVSTTKVMRSYPSCTVTVYLHGTGTLATIFSNATGTPLANPFTANTDGSWQFYLAATSVDITMSGAGISAPFTLSDVLPNGGGGSSSTLAGKPVDTPTTLGQQPTYNNTKFIMQTKLFADVRDYGVVADCATDNTAFLQAALNVCSLASGKSIVTVKLPPGCIQHKGTLFVQGINGGSCNIEGSAVDRSGGAYAPLTGVGTNLVYTGPASGTQFSCLACSGLRMRGFSMNGNGFAKRILELDASNTIVGTPSTKAITSLTRASGVVSVVSAVAHGLQSGDKVMISGTSDSTFSTLGTPVMSVADTTHFTVFLPGSDGSASGGTSLLIKSSGMTNFVVNDVGLSGNRKMESTGIAMSRDATGLVTASFTNPHYAFNGELLTTYSCLDSSYNINGNLIPDTRILSVPTNTTLTYQDPNSTVAGSTTCTVWTESDLVPIGNRNQSVTVQIDGGVFINVGLNGYDGLGNIGASYFGINCNSDGNTKNVLNLMGTPGIAGSRYEFGTCNGFNDVGNGEFANEGKAVAFLKAGHLLKIHDMQGEGNDQRLVIGSGSVNLGSNLIVENVHAAIVPSDLAHIYTFGGLDVRGSSFSPSTGDCPILVNTGVLSATGNSYIESVGNYFQNCATATAPYYSSAGGTLLTTGNRFNVRSHGDSGGNTPRTRFTDVPWFTGTSQSCANPTTQKVTGSDASGNFICGTDQTGATVAAQYIGGDNANHAHVATDTSHEILSTVTVVGGTMLTKSALLVEMTADTDPGNPGACRIQVNFGGASQVCDSVNQNASVSITCHGTVANRNATNAQWYDQITKANGSIVIDATTTSSLNTASNQDLTVDAWCPGGSGNTITLRRWQVLHVPGS